MKLSYYIFTIICLVSVLIISGCDDENDSASVELLQNTSAEDGSLTPSHWLTSSGGAQALWSTQSFVGDHSLQLTSYTATDEGGFWAQSVNDKIPYGKKLILRCKIKLENITGEGVSIAVRGDSNSAPVFFFTTQGEITIAGNMDWKEFSVEMDENIPDNISKIYIFLILLDNTTGTAYFDDISLKKL